MCVCVGSTCIIWMGCGQCVGVVDKWRNHRWTQIKERETKHKKAKKEVYALQYYYSGKTEYTQTNTHSFFLLSCPLTPIKNLTFSLLSIYWRPPSYFQHTLTMKTVLQVVSGLNWCSYNYSSQRNHLNLWNWSALEESSKVYTHWGEVANTYPARKTPFRWFIEFTANQAQHLDF